MGDVPREASPRTDKAYDIALIKLVLKAPR